MDADAYIHDMDFDVRRYLDDKRHYAGIFAGFSSSSKPYDINAGGFALNLGHVLGQEVAIEYSKRVSAIPDREFNRAVIWGKDIPEDQWILFHILENFYEDRGVGESFLFEQANEGYTNNGPFIRQVLRSKASDFQSRMALIRGEIDGIMRGRWEGPGGDQPGYFLRADHPSIRIGNGRRTSGVIRSIGQDGCFTFGPYIPLRAGNYAIRIYGEANAARHGKAMALTSDVASDEGRIIWAGQSELFDGPRKGLLTEYRMSLTGDVERLEVRTFVDEHQDISLHAIQIQWIDEWVPEY